jgi:hypothetical protein
MIKEVAMGTRRLPGNERRTTTFLRSGVLAGACAVALVAGAGDVYTLSAGGNWSAAANWSGAMPTAGGAADATIVFNGTGDIASTNDLSGTFLLNRLESAAGTVTLWGNTLSFVDSGAAGPQVVQAGEGSVTFRNTLSLAADTAFNVANGALTVGPVPARAVWSKPVPARCSVRPMAMAHSHSPEPRVSRTARSLSVRRPRVVL